MKKKESKSQKIVEKQMKIGIKYEKKSLQIMKNEVKMDKKCRKLIKNYEKIQKST